MITPADIVAARRRIAGVAAVTPMEYSRPLSAMVGAEVYLKLECAQVTGSFKVRGATNALLASPDRSPAITCSAGNHALGMAHAAALSGVEVTLVLPETASPAKVAALRSYPVRLILHGQSYDDAEGETLRMAKETGLRFISPYNHPDVITGQGTLGAEILEQLPEVTSRHTDPPVLLVGVGGGGLISGVGVWAKSMNPHTRVIGIQAEQSAAMIASLQAGHIVTAPDLPTLADGLAGNIDPHSITFPIVRRVVDTMLAVSESQIAVAMRWLLDEHHLVVEGSAAVGVAALLHGLVDGVAGRRVVALLCGRNISSAMFLKAIGA